MAGAAGMTPRLEETPPTGSSSPKSQRRSSDSSSGNNAHFPASVPVLAFPAPGLRA